MGQLVGVSSLLVSNTKIVSICSKGDGVYADITRGCKFYYECSFIRTKYARYYEMLCPDNTFFNQKTKTCNLKKPC
jgi:hypothetical protein